jgi:hypothetical protein
MGLVRDRKADLELVKVVDYELSVWELLGRILDTNSLITPFRFMYLYRYNAIGTYAGGKLYEDGYMTQAASLVLDFYLQLPHFGPSDEDLHDDLKAVEIREFGIHIASINVYKSVHVYKSLTYRSHSSELIYLPGDPAKDIPGKRLRACALVGSCDSQCRKYCCSRTILGFARVDPIIEPPVRRHEKTGSVITMEEASLREQSPRAHFYMCNQELEQRLPKLLRSMKNLTRAVKVAPEQYRLDTDLRLWWYCLTFLRSSTSRW